MKIRMRQRRWFVALVSSVLSLIGAELLLRGFSLFGGPFGDRLARSDPLAVRLAPHGEHGYRQQPNRVFPFSGGTYATSNSMGFRGPTVDIPKPAGTFRIVLLGGSTTYGWEVTDDQTIDAYMREILAERYPRVGIEVVNLALDAYDSYQLFERMRTDGMPLAPDLVIVNSGLNDVRNARFSDLSNPDPRTLMYTSTMARMRQEAREGGPSLWTLAKHHSYLIRVPGLMRQSLRARETVQRNLRIAEPRPAALDYFEANLLRTADLAELVGAVLFLSASPSALGTPMFQPSDTSPQTFWIGNAATTEAYRRKLSQRMQQLAVDLQAAGRSVRFLSHNLSEEHFLDDSHLTSSGNRILAASFCRAAAPFIEATVLGRSELVESLAAPEKR